MGILANLKDALWGTKDLTPTPEHDPVEEAYLGTDQAGTGFTPDLDPEPAVLATPAPAPVDDLPTSTAAELRQRKS